MNPANEQQHRLIEKFGASMKRELRKKRKIATDINQYCQISCEVFAQNLENIVISLKIIFSKSFTEFGGKFALKR